MYRYQGQQCGNGAEGRYAGLYRARERPAAAHSGAPQRRQQPPPSRLPRLPPQSVHQEIRQKLTPMFNQQNGASVRDTWKVMHELGCEDPDFQPTKQTLDCWEPLPPRNDKLQKLRSVCCSASPIGQGKEGQVLLVRTKKSQTPIAVKCRPVKKGCVPEHDLAGVGPSSTEVKGMIASNELLRHSPCFVHLLDWFTSDQLMDGRTAPDGQLQQFLVTEWCGGGDLTNFIAHYPDVALHPEFLRAMLFHLVFAVATMQRCCGLVHYDAHDGNILLTKSPECDAVCLQFRDQQFVVPDVGCVFKLTDWSCCFSDQIGCRRQDLQDRPGNKAELAGIEQTFKPFYDMVTIGTFIIHAVGDVNRARSDQNRNKSRHERTVPLLVIPDDCLRFIKQKMQGGREFDKEANSRPLRGETVQDVDPWTALQDSYFDVFRKKPGHDMFDQYETVLRYEPVA